MTKAKDLRTLTMRLPVTLHTQLVTLSERLYQSEAAILRAALLEYLQRHGMPPEGDPAAFILRFPDDAVVTDPE